MANHDEPSSVSSMDCRSEQHIEKGLISHLELTLGKVGESDTLDYGSCWRACVLSIRDRLMELSNEFHHYLTKQDSKRVYLILPEFSGTGCMMQQTLINLDIESQYREALAKIGFDLDRIYKQDRDLTLGYSGLSRLMPEFLDSIATCKLPVFCYGIRFNYGIFEQKIINGWQCEYPDYYLIEDNPYEVHRHDLTFKVKFGGYLKRRQETCANSSPRSPLTHDLPIWHHEQAVEAVASDIIFSGYQTLNCTRVRLWRSIPARGEDKSCSYSRYPPETTDFLAAVREKQAAEELTAVLYPPELPELQLKQNYFFVSACVQDALNTFLLKRRRARVDWTVLPDRLVLQCMDPSQIVLCFPELIRLLMYEHGLNWHFALDLSRRCFNVTFHDLISWRDKFYSAPVLEKVLPCHLQIINDFNLQYLDRVRSIWGDVPQHICPMTIYEDFPLPKKIRWAHLAVVAAQKVNGISETQTRHLTHEIFPYYHTWFQDETTSERQSSNSTLVNKRQSSSASSIGSTNVKFLSISNGVSPRRWLLSINPYLSNLITATLSSSAWVRELAYLSRLSERISDLRFTSDWGSIKKRNKQRLIDQLASSISEKNASLFRCPHSTTDLSSESSSSSSSPHHQPKCLCVDTDAMYDVHITSITDHTRLLLNAFFMIYRFLKLKNLLSESTRRKPLAKRVSLVGGKSLPGDFTGKLLIKLIHSIAAVVNSDPLVNKYYRIHFVHDAYQLLPAIVPATDLYLQLALPGSEAASTGAVKFLLNGSLLLTTLTSSTIELLEATHRDVAFVFGVAQPEVENVRNQIRQGELEVDPRLHEVFQYIRSGALSASDTDTQQKFQKLVDDLIFLKGNNQCGDSQLTCHDFAAYVQCQERAETMFAEDPIAWTRLSVRSASAMGRFSSDRMVTDYAEKVWEVDPQERLDASRQEIRSVLKGVITDSIVAITTPRVPKTPRSPDCIFPRLAYQTDRDVFSFITTGSTSVTTKALNGLWEELSDRLEHIEWIRLLRMGREHVVTEGTGSRDAMVFVKANTQAPELYEGPLDADSVLLFLGEHVSRGPFIPAGRKLSKLVCSASHDSFIYLRGNEDLTLDESWIDLTDRLSVSSNLSMQAIDRSECKVNYDGVPESGTAFLFVPAGATEAVVLDTIDDVDEVVATISRHARHTIRVQPALLSRAIYNRKLERTDVLLCTNPGHDSEVDDVWMEVHERIVPEQVQLRTMTYDLDLRRSDVLRIQTGPGFFLKVASDNSIEVYEGPTDADSLMVWLESRLGRSLMDSGKPFHRVAFRNGIDVVLQITDPETSRNSDWCELWDELQERLQSNSALRFFEWTKPVDHAGFSHPIERPAVFLTRKNSATSEDIQEFSGPLEIDAMLSWVCDVHGKQLEVKPRSLSRQVFKQSRDVLVMIFRDDSERCKKFVNVWAELLERTMDSPNLTLTEYDGYLNKPDVPGFDYGDDFPSFFLIAAHSNIPIQYTGEHQADPIMDFIRLHSRYQVIDSGKRLSRMLFQDDKIVLLSADSNPVADQPTDSPPCSPRYVRPPFWSDVMNRTVENASLEVSYFDLFHDRIRNDMPGKVVAGIYMTFPGEPVDLRDTEVIRAEDGMEVYRFAPTNLAECSNSDTILTWAMRICPTPLLDLKKSFSHFLAEHERDTIYVKIGEAPVSDTSTVAETPAVLDEVWTEVQERSTDAQISLLSFDGDCDAFPVGSVFVKLPGESQMHPFTGPLQDANSHIEFLKSHVQSEKFRPQKFSRFAHSSEKDVIVYVATGSPNGLSESDWDALCHRCRNSENADFRVFEVTKGRLDDAAVRSRLQETDNQNLLVVMPGGGWGTAVCSSDCDDDKIVRELQTMCTYPLSDAGKSLTHMLRNEERHVLLRLHKSDLPVLHSESPSTSASTPVGSQCEALETENDEWIDATERLGCPLNQSILRIIDLNVGEAELNVETIAPTAFPSYVLVPSDKEKPSSEFHKHLDMMADELVDFVQKAINQELKLVPPRLSRLLFQKSKDVVLYLTTIDEDEDEDIYGEVQERIESEHVAFIEYDRNATGMDVPCLISSPQPSIFVVAAGTKEPKPFVPDANVDNGDAAVELLKSIATSPLRDLGKPLSRVLASLTGDALMKIVNGEEAPDQEWEEVVWRLSDSGLLVHVFDGRQGYMNLPQFEADKIYYCRKKLSNLLVPSPTPEVGIPTGTSTAEDILAYVKQSNSEIRIKPRPLRRLCFDPRQPVVLRVSELKKKSQTRMIGDKAWGQVIDRIGHCDIRIESIRGPISPSNYSQEDRDYFPYTAPPSLYLTLPSVSSPPLEYDSVWNANSIVNWLVRHVPSINDLGLRLSDLLDDCGDNDVFLRLSRSDSVDLAELAEWEEVEGRVEHSENLKLINFCLARGRLDVPGLRVDETMRSTIYLLPLKAANQLMYAGPRLADPMIAFLKESCSTKVIATCKPLARLIFRGDRDVMVKVGCPKSEASVDFVPIWEEVGERTCQSLKLDLVEFDCTTELPNVMGVERSIAPRLYLVPARTETVIPFIGDKTCDAIIAFAVNNCVHTVVATGRPFARVLFQKTKDVFVKVFDPSMELEEDSVWAELVERTSQNDADLCITEFDGSEMKAKIEGFEVGELPAFIFSRAGARMPIAYIGDHCADSMLAFLKEYSAFPLKISPKSLKRVMNQPTKDVLIMMVTSGDDACEGFRSIWDEVVERLEPNADLAFAIYNCGELPPNVDTVAVTGLPRLYLAVNRPEKQELVECSGEFLDPDAILDFVAKTSRFETVILSRSFSRTAFQRNQDVFIKVVRGQGGQHFSPRRAVWRELIERVSGNGNLELCEYDCDRLLPDVEGVEVNGVYLAPAGVQTLLKFEGEMSVECLIEFLQTYAKFPVIATQVLMRAVAVAVSAEDGEEEQTQDEPQDDEEESMYSEVDSDHHSDYDEKILTVQKRNRFVSAVSSAVSSPATTAHEDDQ